MSECIVPKDFYVYVHRRASDGKIFYVGKGHGKRARSDKNRNIHWQNVASKHQLTVEIVQDGLQEWYAFELERELIALHGRETLCNMTDGGEGPSGWVPNEKNRLALSIVKKGKRLSEKHRLAMSHAKKGKPQSEKHRLAIRAAMRAAMSKPILCEQTGLVFQTTCCAQKWLRENGKNKASAGPVGACCRGKLKSAYGYNWCYAQK